MRHRISPTGQDIPDRIRDRIILAQVRLEDKPGAYRVFEAEASGSIPLYVRVLQWLTRIYASFRLTRWG
jgi:hypothetical protein